MLSRTADNLFWLARYVERAEYLARILDTTYRLTALPLARYTSYSPSSARSIECVRQPTSPRTALLWMRTDSSCGTCDALVPLPLPKCLSIGAVGSGCV